MGGEIDMESHIGCADCAIIKRNYKRNPEFRMVVAYNGYAPCQSKLKPTHTIQAVLAMHKDDHEVPVYTVAPICYNHHEFKRRPITLYKGASMRPSVAIRPRF